MQGTFFHRGKEEIVRGCFEQEFAGEDQEFRVMAASHRLGHCWGKRKVFLLLAGVCKVSFNEQHMCESTLFIASQLQFGLISHNQQVINKLENIHTMKFYVSVNMCELQLNTIWWKEYQNHKVEGGNEVANKLIQKDPINRVQKQKNSNLEIQIDVAKLFLKANVMKTVVTSGREEHIKKWKVRTMFLNWILGYLFIVPLYFTLYIFYKCYFKCT